MLSQIYVILFNIAKKSLKNLKTSLLINEDKKFFSKYDIKYSIDLFHKKKDKPNSECRLQRLFNTNIYQWDNNFKYSSRIINAHFVGFLSLYYFFTIWIYSGLLFLDFLDRITVNLGINIIYSSHNL